MPMKISSLVRKSQSGVMYFDMFSNIMDVTEITDEKMSVLLDTLMTADICEYIVVDMNTSLKGINSIIMDKADKIILVETPDTICGEKLRRFCEQKSMFEDYFSKAAVVRNKVADGGADSVTGLEVVSAVPRISGGSAESVVDEIVKRARLDIGRVIS